jgi:hypothetical protein
VQFQNADAVFGHALETIIPHQWSDSDIRIPSRQTRLRLSESKDH